MQPRPFEPGASPGRWIATESQRQVLLARLPAFPGDLDTVRTEERPRLSSRTAARVSVTPQEVSQPAQLLREEVTHSIPLYYPRRILAIGRLSRMEAMRLSSESSSPLPERTRAQSTN